MKARKEKGWQKISVGNELCRKLMRDGRGIKVIEGWKYMGTGKE